MTSIAFSADSDLSNANLKKQLVKFFGVKISSFSYFVKSNAVNPVDVFLSAKSIAIETFFSLAPHVPLTMYANAASEVTSMF